MAISKGVRLVSISIYIQLIRCIFTKDCNTDSTSLTYTTGTRYNYNWESIFVSPSTTNFTFQVMAANDVHIGLSAQNRNLPNFYEIVIGGWENTQSTIRQGAQNDFQDYKPQQTPNMLDPNEFREFTISWKSGDIRVYRTGDASPFLEYKHTSPFPVRYIGFTTGYGSTGEFMFCALDSEIPLADKVVSQSSTAYRGPAARAVDGNTNGNYDDGNSCTHTEATGGWWMVDFGRSVRIETVLVYNRVDQCCRKRLTGAVIRIGDDPERNNSECGTVSPEQIADGQLIITLCDLSGRYLSIHARPQESLQLCEVKVFENLNVFIDIPLVGRTAFQSSPSTGGLPNRAIDGNADSNYELGQSCSKTQSEQGPFPWWMVDLENSFKVNKVVIYNRDDCCAELLDGAILRLGDDPDRTMNPTCGTVTSQQITIGPEIIFYCDMMVGRYLSIEQTRSNPLTLCEVKLYGNEYSYTTIASTSVVSATSPVVLPDSLTGYSGVVPVLTSVIVILLILLIGGVLWILFRRRSRKENGVSIPEQPRATCKNDYLKPRSNHENHHDGDYIGLSKDREDTTYTDLIKDKEVNTYEDLKTKDHPGNELDYYEADPSGLIGNYENSPTAGPNHGLVYIYANSANGEHSSRESDNSEYAYVNTLGNRLNNDQKVKQVFAPDDEEYSVVT